MSGILAASITAGIDKSINALKCCPHQPPG